MRRTPRAMRPTSLRTRSRPFGRVSRAPAASTRTRPTSVAAPRTLRPTRGSPTPRLTPLSRPLAPPVRSAGSQRGPRWAFTVPTPRNGPWPCNRAVACPTRACPCTTPSALTRRSTFSSTARRRPCSSTLARWRPACRPSAGTWVWSIYIVGERYLRTRRTPSCRRAVVEEGCGHIHIYHLYIIFTPPAPSSDQSSPPPPPTTSTAVPA